MRSEGDSSMIAIVSYSEIVLRLYYFSRTDLVKVRDLRVQHIGFQLRLCRFDLVGIEGTWMSFLRYSKVSLLVYLRSANVKRKVRQQRLTSFCQMRKFKYSEGSSIMAIMLRKLFESQGKTLGKQLVAQRFRMSYLTTEKYA